MQDAGSQLVASLAATAGLVLDACAAPGGKALLMADLVGDRGRVIAADASPKRLGDPRPPPLPLGRFERLPLAADALRPAFASAFDAVLLDAPCSGLGTLARNPDIRWRLCPEDPARQATRQRALLESVAPLVRPGGRLVYATCSVEPEENEDVVGPFLEGHPELRDRGPAAVGRPLPRPRLRPCRPRAPPRRRLLRRAAPPGGADRGGCGNLTARASPRVPHLESLEAFSDSSPETPSSARPCSPWSP